MMIRQATKEDINEIKNIIDDLQVSREQKDWERAEYGFFEYKKSKGELTKLINPYFTVAETKKGIGGFLLAYDDNLFKKLHKNSTLVDWKFILNNFKQDFLYWDMLAVSNPKTQDSKNVSKKLIDYTFDLSRKNNIKKVVGFVCERPWLSKRGRGVIIKNGFKKFKEVEIDNGITLGAYELNL